MRILFPLALLTALGLSLSCTPEYADPELNGPAGIVHFPDGWTKVIGNGTRGVNDNIHLWIEDCYLIMPLNWWLEDCLVGVLPEK